MINKKGLIKLTYRYLEVSNYTLKLKRIQKVNEGANYLIESAHIKMLIWLCEVTKLYFNNTLPKNIYIV